MKSLRNHHLIIATLLTTISIVTARSIHGVSNGWMKLSSNLHGIVQQSISDTRRAHRHHHHHINSSFIKQSSILSIRGGDTTNNDVVEEDDEEEERRKKRKEEHNKLIKYRTSQQLLYQLRSTYLTEILSSRGIQTIPTLSSVSTPEGSKPPTKIDWECTVSTYEDPKSCLYSFDAEPNTKVIAPYGTTQWISLIALNRLRRTDPTKVEPMWHSQYAILSSWFNDTSEYSLLQHVGIKGFIISSILLDQTLVLRSLLILSILSTVILFMPIIEVVVQRILVSSQFWSKWTTWGRVIRAGFPLKLLIGQLVWKGIAKSFTKVENEVREYIIDLECEILEDCVPVTLGVDNVDEDEEGEEGIDVGDGDIIGDVDSEGEEDDIMEYDSDDGDDYDDDEYDGDDY